MRTCVLTLSVYRWMYACVYIVCTMLCRFECCLQVLARASAHRSNVLRRDKHKQQHQCDQCCSFMLLQSMRCTRRRTCILSNRRCRDGGSDGDNNTKWRVPVVPVKRTLQPPSRAANKCAPRAHGTDQRVGMTKPRQRQQQS